MSLLLKMTDMKTLLRCQFPVSLMVENSSEMMRNNRVSSEAHWDIIVGS